MSRFILDKLRFKFGGSEEASWAADSSNIAMQINMIGGNV